MEETGFDVVVMGAGIMGSATAYHLVKEGRKVLLLEQFSLPHTRGSSHGQSRGIRKAYPQECYAKMMDEALDSWVTLEKEAETSLLWNIGLLVVGPKGSPCLEETDQTLKKVNAPHQRLTHGELVRRYPMYRYPVHYEGVLDESGGLLWASKALMAYQMIYRRRGGVLHDREKVLQIYPGEVITVQTSRGRYQTKSVVITVGPWAPTFLKGIGLHLPLKPIRTGLFYWKTKKVESTSMLRTLPAMSEKVGPDSDENYVYMVPANEYPGHMKICIHRGPVADPDSPGDADQSGILGELSSYIQKHIPGIHGDRPSINESCMITVTPDQHFILDKHPQWKNIVIGAGFSGHGFKLAPVVGNILAHLALDKLSPHDLSPFRISRFTHRKKSSL